MKRISILYGIVKAVVVFATVQFDSLQTTPQGWIRLGKAPANATLSFRIALTQRDHDLFEQTLFAISTPTHPSYGKHLNSKDAKDIVRSTNLSIESVLYWLQKFDVLDAQIDNSSGNSIRFKATIAQAEAMMGTEYYFFEDRNGLSKIRTLKYSVPTHIAPHIVMIHPTTHFGKSRAEKLSLSMANEDPLDLSWQNRASDGTSFNITACNTTITPDCLRVIYHMADYRIASPTNGSLLGICGYLKQYAKYDAYERFVSEYAPQARGQNFTYVLVNGGLNLQNDTIDNDLEGNLDVMYTGPMIVGTKVNYYSTGGLGYLVPDLDQPTQEDNKNEPYLELLDYLSTVPDSELPQTLVTSYGEDEQSIPEGYARTVCDGFGTLGLRGVSVIFSSGDTGVGSSCQTNDGKNTTRFSPMFPAACPYVTSVGATRHFQPESSVYFSSGGFSDRFPRPPWQDNAVKGYLEVLGDQWNGLYNPDGRGFPDVSAQGWAFQYLGKNASTDEFDHILGYGTSAAAPTFASVISLLNSARLSAGEAPLGFLNPWLYSVGKEGLNDVVHGGSKGCTGVDVYSGLPTPHVPYASWNATVGWDPVSGLGTPDFRKLLVLSSQ
ncbi:hypothetical protein BP6252_13332 [Coleophoma cylindrospora]|uniref:tripeptidyl-peptidase II n=1 Tax=Coleophoma cylindrospora TaxID=1849047 RepID=A0A3D8QAK0_9HELO|nr:hypothetical protein BP6252_13332 [Coleophoma cylindrospora]